jgi:hypothetical protein
MPSFKTAPFLLNTKKKKKNDVLVFFMEDKENNVLATGHYVLFEAKKIPYGERLKIRENE